jgi:thiol-disulfide isomerase/thioredoxin
VADIIGKLVPGDENPEIASKYNIMSIPSFLVFKDGQPVDQVVGVEIFPFNLPLNFKVPVKVKFPSITT